MVRLRVVIGALAASASARAQLLQFNPTSCLPNTQIGDADQLLTFDQGYAQYDQGQLFAGERVGGVNLSSVPALYTTNSSQIEGVGSVLRIVLTGTTNGSSDGYSNVTTFLSTISQTTSVLTFPISQNQSALCSAIRTDNKKSQDPGTGCPYGPGNVGMGVSIPMSSSYQMTTFSTQLVVLDSSVPALTLACYNLNFTPYYPAYFPYKLVRWLVVAILALYLFLYCVARLWAAQTHWQRDNETFLATSLTLKLSTADTPLSRRQRWGSIWLSAWAGRQLVSSGSLRRYLTADFREVFTTLAWFSLVGAVAVEWPGFSYPIFALLSWTSLIYTNSLPFTSSPAPLLTSDTTLPSNFANEMQNVNSPLYLNTSLPSVLLDLGEDNAVGIRQWAAAAGVRHEDLWSVCAFTFFVICAAVIGLHLLMFAVERVLDLIWPSQSHKSRASMTKIPSVKGPLEQHTTPEEDEQAYTSLSNTNSKEARGDSFGSNRMSTTSLNRYEAHVDSNDPYSEDAANWSTKLRTEDDIPSWKLHLAWLQGNLTRILLLFHLPLSIFSVYQFTLFHSAPTSTFALAVVTFLLVCVGAPAFLMWQIHRKTVRQLYTSLEELLSLGVLYSIYSDECTLFSGCRLAANLVVAVLIGAVQSTGTAQAAVIVLVEVVDTLVTSLWLPWGDNSAMGPLAFLLSISRIIIAVLLVVLSPAVGISQSAAAWLAYVVLLIQALVIVLFLFCLVFKLLELAVRLIGQVPFDESRSPRAGGLFGALGRSDRRTTRKRKAGGGARRASNAAARQRRHDQLRYRTQSPTSENTQGTTARMLPDRGGESTTDSSFARGGNGQNDDYIMSPLNNGTWTSSAPGPGYVKAGQYSAQAQPILRSGPSWSSGATVVPASAAAAVGSSAAMAQASSSPATFARVGGGRASSGNPYVVTSAPGGNGAYPPYPNSAANPRRLSQSAVIEMAGPSGPNDLPSGAGASGSNKQRPPLNLPSSSQLLSNEISRLTSSLPSPGAAGASHGLDEPQGHAGGFFGRFRRAKPQRQDTWSDDDDEEEESDEEMETLAGRKAGRMAWLPSGLIGGARRKRDSQQERPQSPVPEESTGETGFVVTRKARPRPNLPLQTPDAAQPQLAGTAPGTPVGGAHDSDPLLSRPVPHVSVEAPSRPSSPQVMRGGGGGGEGNTK